jgi:hypothetical protein
MRRSKHPLYSITKTSRNLRRSPFPCILGWDTLPVKRRPEA